MILKNLVSFMQENIFRTNLLNYWRNIDKKIFVSFIILFFLGAAILYFVKVNPSNFQNTNEII